METIVADMNIGDWILYGLKVMSFQKPEPRPTGIADVLVVLQTIIGPIQAALFALAVRRKFM